MPRSNNPGYYICSTYKVDKPLSEFWPRNGEHKYPSQAFGSVCKECQTIYLKKKAPQWREERKLKVFVEYSGDPPSCQCCGETEIRFLTIDHINGGGAKHRRDVTGTGSNFYQWLIDNDSPDEFRVLCYNCNCCMSHGGICPHEDKRRQAQAAD